MTNQIEPISIKEDVRRKWLSIGLTALIAGLLTVWGIYGMGDYGIALFVLTPIFIGAGSTIFYGIKRDLSYGQAWRIGLTTLGVYTLGLLIFAIEGLICIAMAAPIGVLLTWIGSIIGYGVTLKTPNKAVTSLILITCLIPGTAFIEKDAAPKLVSVVTSIEIDANPEIVWKNVVEFPQLEEPSEFIFKAGISYPINAQIQGTGVGAVRYCNFTTGSFIEPITIWDEPKLLKFKVLEQPTPMKEISFWDIDAPHLHDYFVSKEGQFKLTELPNGRTKLEGTTWYYHNIKPSFYWRIWSNFIIHKIHNRVLSHIKKNAEKNLQSGI